MGAARSFAEILEEKLTGTESKRSPKQDSFQSSSQEFDTQPAHLAYLMGQILRPNFAQKSPSKSYPSHPPKPRPPHQLSESQQRAYRFFTQWGENLAPNYSKAELKSAFRRLAKRLHPDLSKRSGVEFMELREAFKELGQVPRR